MDEEVTTTSAAQENSIHHVIQENNELFVPKRIWKRILPCQQPTQRIMFSNSRSSTEIKMVFVNILPQNWIFSRVAQRKAAGIAGEN